jgi:predicted Zn-dependent peptidase
VNGVSQKVLDETKSNLKYDYAMSIDNPDAIANSLCHFIYLTGDPESLNNFYSLYDKVTVDDIKMVTNKFFIDSGLTIATISADEIEESNNEIINYFNIAKWIYYGTTSCRIKTTQFLEDSCQVYV